MRSLYLMPLAAILAACANQNAGINASGGDAFVLETRNVSGRAAVDQGLAQAQSFCSEHGRLFVLTDSRVGSGSYRVNFRCIAMTNALPPPPVVASAPPPPPPRPARGRRATTAPDALASGPPLGFPAVLPAMTAPAATTPWSPGTSNVAAVLPPVATTPLFAPAPGVALAVPPLSGPRLPGADNSPMVALPRLEEMASSVQTPDSQAVMMPSGAQTAGTSASPAGLTRDALPPVTSLPLLQSGSAGQTGLPAATTPSVQAEPLPPVQAQPLAASAAPLSIPPPSFGLVPSPNPLPGASTSLPPIAGGSTRPVPLPGGGGGSTFSSGSTGFTQGFR